MEIFSLQVQDLRRFFIPLTPYMHIFEGEGSTNTVGKSPKGNDNAGLSLDRGWGGGIFSSIG